MVSTLKILDLDLDKVNPEGPIHGKLLEVTVLPLPLLVFSRAGNNKHLWHTNCRSGFEQCVDN